MFKFSGLKKKLFAISKEKDCGELQQWIKSIINHLYWTAATSEGLEADVILARWLSLNNHIINIHSDHSALFTTCEHGPLEGRERHKLWLKPGMYVVLYIINTLSTCIYNGFVTWSKDALYWS